MRASGSARRRAWRRRPAAGAAPFHPFSPRESKFPPSWVAFFCVVGHLLSRSPLAASEWVLVNGGILVGGWVGLAQVRVFLGLNAQNVSPGGRGCAASGYLSTLSETSVSFRTQ